MLVRYRFFFSFERSRCFHNGKVAGVGSAAVPHRRACFWKIAVESIPNNIYIVSIFGAASVVKVSHRSTRYVLCVENERRETFVPLSETTVKRFSVGTVAPMLFSEDLYASPGT